MQGEEQEERRKLFGFATSDSGASKTQGKTGGGIEALTKVVDENTMGLLPEVAKAMQDPVNEAPENFQSTLEKGKQFYEGELSAKDVYNNALIKFKGYKKSKTDKVLKEYSAKDYYYLEIKKAGIDKVLVSKHIKRAYKNVFGSDLQVPDLLEKTKADNRVQIYNDAQVLFKKWNKSRVKGGFKKSKRISEAKKYYKQKVNIQETMEDKNLYAATIRAAYQSIFGEDIF